MSSLETVKAGLAQHDGVSSLETVKAGLAELIKHDGVLTSIDQEAVDILCHTFEEMFVNDDEPNDHEGNEGLLGPLQL